LDGSGWMILERRRGEREGDVGFGDGREGTLFCVGWGGGLRQQRGSWEERLRVKGEA
jgi:hypothetical protein